MLAFLISVAMTTCYDNAKPLAVGEIVIFKEFYTLNGINSTAKEKIANSGKFTCEKPGLYLIATFIMTDTDQAVLLVYKNDNMINRIHAYYSTSGHYQTGTMVFLDNLKQHDTISIRAYEQLTVRYQSCFSVLQIV